MCVDRVCSLLEVIVASSEEDVRTRVVETDGHSEPSPLMSDGSEEAISGRCLLDCARKGGQI